MMRRRNVLGFLAACMAAVFTSAHAAHTRTGQSSARRNNPKLVLHKGWILRADDPRS
jgi:hypothetical protein